MNTPIEKHPNYTEFHQKLIALVSEQVGCELVVTYKENMNVVYAQIEKVVLEEYNITRQYMLHPTRKTIASEPRYVMAYLLRKYTPLNDVEIARRLEKDRSTIIYGYNQMQLAVEKNIQPADRINRCINILKSLS